jgi:hypothetical protein
MKRFFFAAAILAALCVQADAACFGSGSFKTCYDTSGNSYTVSKFGNSTFVNGYNSRTGSTWNQNSTSFGNSTYSTGRASNGRYWDETETTYGGTTNIFGTDSDGNSFSTTCTVYACD